MREGNTPSESYVKFEGEESSHSMSAESANVVGYGSTSIVYKMKLGTNDKALKVLVNQDYAKQFDINTRFMMRLRGSPYILIPEKKGELSESGTEKACTLMELMGIDCALWIDNLNKTKEGKWDNPNAFQDEEVLASAYSIILNLLKSVEYLHSNKVYAVDFNPFNVLLRGNFLDGKFLEDPESLEVRISDLWPDKPRQIGPSNPTYCPIDPRRNSERISYMRGYCSSPKEFISECGFDQTNANLASALYSVGIIAIELLTGKHPHKQNAARIDNADRLYQVSNKMIPKEIGEIIISLIRPEPTIENSLNANNLFEKLKEAVNKHFCKTENKPEDKVREVTQNKNGYYYVPMSYHQFNRVVCASFNGVPIEGALSRLITIYESTNKQQPINATHRKRINSCLRSIITEYVIAIGKEQKRIEEDERKANTDVDARISEVRIAEQGYDIQIKELQPQIAALRTSLSRLETQLSEINTLKKGIEDNVIALSAAKTSKLQELEREKKVCENQLLEINKMLKEKRI